VYNIICPYKTLCKRRYRAFTEGFVQRAVYAHRLQTEGLLSFKLRVTLCGNFHERERGMICEVDGNGNFKRAEVGTET